ncbi:hypothetical protein ABZ953_18855 [Streptomyces sp. NPDC046465]|uniref:hypothetical protein n=1 Tax=Streptomyces sp. NPDC046465 TaxID=3155810 RepID=UPI0033FDB9F4
MSGTGRVPAGYAAPAYGTVPDWVAAVGTVAATLLLAVGLLREIRRRRIDDARAATERRAAEANQARLVSVVFRARGSGLRVECVVRNDSPAPVRDAVPWLSWVDPAGALHVPQTEVGANAPLLGPGETTEMTLSVTERAEAPDASGSLRCALAFTDANGRRWVRTANGAPTAVLDDESQALIRAVRADHRRGS